MRPPPRRPRRARPRDGRPPRPPRGRRPSRPPSGRRLDLGPGRLGRRDPLGLDGRQAQGVGHHEAAVDQGPGHLARRRRVAPAQRRCPGGAGRTAAGTGRTRRSVEFSSATRSRPSSLIVRIVAWPLSPERNRTDWASRLGPATSFDLDRSRASVSGPASACGDRRDHGRAVGAEDLAEVGVGGVLVEHRQGHRAVLGQGLDRLVAEGRRRRSPRRPRRPRRARPGVRARSPRSPCSTTSRRAFGLPPTASTSPAAATCRRWPATVSGRWRPEQLVDVLGVDPQQDQRLVERQGPAERVEDRAVER